MKPSKLQFSTPILKDFHFEVNEDFLSNLSEMDEIENPKVEYNISCTDVEDNSFFMFSTLTIGEQNENAPFYSYITMGAQFHLDSKVSKDELAAYQQIHCPAHLVSYMRPIVAMITSMTPYPTFQLPFLNFTEN